MKKTFRQNLKGLGKEEFEILERIIQEDVERYLEDLKRIGCQYKIR